MVWNQEGQGSRYTLYKVNVETAQSRAPFIERDPLYKDRPGIAAIDLNAALARSRTAGPTAISPAFGRLPPKRSPHE